MFDMIIFELKKPEEYIMNDFIQKIRLYILLGWKPIGVVGTAYGIRYQVIRKYFTKR